MYGGGGKNIARVERIKSFSVRIKSREKESTEAEITNRQVTSGHDDNYEKEGNGFALVHLRPDMGDLYSWRGSNQHQKQRSYGRLGRNRDITAYVRWGICTERLVGCTIMVDLTGPD